MATLNPWVGLLGSDCAAQRELRWPPLPTVAMISGFFLSAVPDPPTLKTVAWNPIPHATLQSLAPQCCSFLRLLRLQEA